MEDIFPDYVDYPMGFPFHRYCFSLEVDSQRSIWIYPKSFSQVGNMCGDPSIL